MKLLKLTENAISGNLNPVLDSFLQDVAQMTQAISYDDIITFAKCAQPHQISALETLRKGWAEVVDYDDDNELNEIAQHVAAIVHDVKCDVIEECATSDATEEPTPVKEALTNREKLKRAFPELNFDAPLTEDLDVATCIREFLDNLVEQEIVEEYSPAYRLIEALLRFMKPEDACAFCRDDESDELTEAVLTEAPFLGRAKNIFGNNKNVEKALDKDVAKANAAGNKRYDKLAKDAMAAVAREIKGKGNATEYLYWVDPKQDALTHDEWVEFVEENKGTAQGRAKIYNTIVTDASGRRIIRRGVEDLSKAPIVSSTTNKTLRYVWEADQVISAKEAANKPGMFPDSQEEVPEEEDPKKTPAKPEDPDEDPSDEGADEGTDDPSEDPSDESGEDGEKGEEEEPKKEDDKKGASNQGNLPAGITPKHLAKFKQLAYLGGITIYDAFDKPMKLNSVKDLAPITPETVYDYRIDIRGKRHELVKWLQTAVKSRVITEEYDDMEAIEILSEATLIYDKTPLTENMETPASAVEFAHDDSYGSFGAVKSINYLEEAFKPIKETSLYDGDVTEEDAFFAAFN